MPYLIGPNSEAITPNRNSATNRTAPNGATKPSDRDRGDADLGELEPLRHHRLVVAVGELAAERGQKEIGRDEDRGGERDQRFGVASRRCWNRIRKTSEFLRKLSLKAEKNWHQNSGAKRRVRSKDEDMAVPVVGSGGAAR